MMRTSLRYYSSVLFLMAGVLLFGSSAKADTCSSLGGTYADLITAGSCTIEDITLSGFSFSSSASGGATALLSSDVTYSVVDQGSDAIGLYITLPFDVDLGESAGASVDFTLSPTIWSWSLIGTTTGGALASDTGSFNCGGNLFSTGFHDLGSFNYSQTFTTGVPFCINNQAYTITGGSGGSGTITYTETIDTTPEPSPLVLLASGLLAMALVMRKRLANESRLS